MNIPLGMSLPHGSPDPIDMTAVREVAQRAEALGFRDLWVTENAVDHVYSFDPAVVLTYAAAVTTKIRLGVAVSVLPIRNPIHPSAMVAVRRSASGWPTPNQIGGCGFCTGLGAMVPPSS